ncbi:MAG: hypothetical protein EPO35_02345 [Acidobacteria bacterium]|nr:MAG: hypothetical protein EPO35_02345 [Acidobacteriota bacterium]
MQNYANHARTVPLYHYVAGPLLIINALYAIWQLKNGLSADSVLFATTAVSLVLIGFYARAFALKAQDRVIRLEMRLRLREILPPRMHGDINRLTVPQLTGLRFAGDAELPDLVAAALKDNLGRRDIKKLVKDWQADDERV